ncbi:MAG TPA: arginase family protein [Candidatus Dormibacteraeota bacterium]|nr:arginase family protein [Candidatus Dormibacteraeota bacterium]
MAVKIVRQPNKIALIGAPSSAAAFAPGHERAPAALRAAGLAERLAAAGYEVSDLGDCAPQVFADDDDHPRARNLSAIVAGLNDLRPRVEMAIKSGALPLVLGGECIQALGVIAGARRYYKHVSLLWMDRDADLNTPGTTPSGRVDGMAMAHIVGRGAPELVRFWGEPPLVREPDITLFGIERIDPPEQEFLKSSPMRHLLAVDVQRMGAKAAAEQVLERMHADGHEIILHFDLDVVAQEDFAAVDLPGPGGLRLGEVREALQVFAKHKNVVALEVTEYNPEKDLDARGAQIVVDILTEALTARLAALTAEPSAAITAADLPLNPESPSSSATS